MIFNNGFNQDYGANKADNPDIFTSPRQSGQKDRGTVYGDNLEYGGIKNTRHEPEPLPPVPSPMMADQMRDALGRPYFFDY